MSIRTIKVSNISAAASERDIEEFFSFSGDIQYVEVKREIDDTQVAHVTFNDSDGAQTAVLLSGAVIADRAVSIALVEDYQLPVEEGRMISAPDSTIRKAEEVVSSMLAKGFVLGKDAVNKAKGFDQQHHFTSSAFATVASVDERIGLSEKLSMGSSLVNGKVKEMDERFHVSEKTKSAFSVAERAGSAILKASWVSNALGAVVKATEDVSVMTKKKVEKAEEERQESIYRERMGYVNNFVQIHLDESPVELADDVQLNAL